jgi:hypothetical protein
MAETGHVKNVENLQKAVNFATGWGANYAPSNPMLDIAAMTALQTAGEASLDGEPHTLSQCDGDLRRSV